MPWYELTYVQCSVLTAEKMTRLQGNLAALAAQDSGAPLIGFPNSPTPSLQAVGTSSVQALHVASGVAAPSVSSLAAIQVASGIAAPQVSSFGTAQVGSGVLAPQVSSFGTVHVGSGLVVAAGAARSLPRGHISGLVLANNATDADHDVDVSVGSARDDSDSADLVLASAITKRIDASWAAGTNQGGLDGTESVAGAPDADTWYHVWLIRRSDTGGVDVLFSESPTAPTLPANYDARRRIGAVRTDGSANVIAFAARETAGGGLHVVWASPPQDADSTIGATAANLALSVPPGHKVLADVYLQSSTGNSGAIRLGSPDQDDDAPSTSYNGGLGIILSAISARARLQVATDTSGQVRIQGSAAGQDYAVYTDGWIDERR